MNEVEHEAAQEAAGLGQELVEQVAVIYGLEEDAPVHRIEKAIFKGTDCGAWIKFTETGLSVGSIVEGSDVDCTQHDLEWTGEEDVAGWLEQALGEIEVEAHEIWVECND